MNTALLIACLVAVAFTAPAVDSHRISRGAVAHTSSSFEFTVGAPYERVAPLFGADAERAWADDEWDPRFLHPDPARDVEGAVFTLTRGGHTAVWISTVFDLEHGHVAYAYVIPDVLATRIDIRLTRPDAATTHVRVLYERTALAPAVDERVEAMGAHDAAQGPEWKAGLERALATPATAPGTPAP